MKTITFQCYSCHQVLKVGADKAGRKAKCVKCGAMLTIPAAEAIEDPPELPDSLAGPAEQDRPRSTRGRRDEPVADEERPPRRRSRAEDEDDEAERRRSRDDDDEDDDRPRSRKSRADEDDDLDDDRPPRRSSRDDEDEEEEEEERPRSRRSRDDGDDEDEDRPRKRRSRDDDDDRGRRRSRKPGNPWPKVRTGLLLNFIGAIILIGYAGLSVLATLLGYIGILAKSPGMLEAASVIAIIGLVVFLVAALPALTGYFFSIFTPNKRGALALAITCTSLGVVNLVLKVLGYIPYFRSGREGPATRFGAVIMGTVPILGASIQSFAVGLILMLVVLAVMGAEWIIYTLYLRSVAAQLKDRYLQSGCFRALGFACAVVGAQLILVLISLIWAHNAGGGVRGAGVPAMLHVLFILRIFLYGGMVAFAIFYMRIIQQIRSSVD